jgi:rhodanese-related sulfurtransferase
MKPLLIVLLLISFTQSVAIANEETTGDVKGLKVKITRNMESVVIGHNGKKVKIQRNQNTKNKINPDFAYTSRKCPPFCIQPIKLAPGVETIAETEMIDYLIKKENGDDNIVVIDSRGASWVKKGTIPGSINIHFKKLSLKHGDEAEIAEIFEDTFGVMRTAEFWNFKNAKTLVLFCNGMWCGQAPTSIKALLKIGYPAHKLKWYRGGMQSWEILGLTTVKP